MRYLPSIAYPLSTGNISAILPNVCHYYKGTFAGTMKMSKKGKHGKWNKTKKKSGIPFTCGKIAEIR
jgi:hypothetical protein